MLHPHLQRLHDALKSEERFSRAEHERVERLPVIDRVALGAAWAPVVFEDEGPVRRGMRRVRVRGDLHDGIGPGDRVRVGTVEGRCTGRDPGVAELVVRADRESWERAATSGVVDQVFDPGTLVRYRQALEAADALEHPLKQALIAGVTPGEPIEEGWERLNAAQAQAAGIALGAATLAVLHGPPGTGKTRTLAALLARLDQRALALAESNAAVDHLALTAAAEGIGVVRIGAPARMSGPVQALSLDTRMREGPFAAALTALDREISRARKEGGPALWKLLDTRRDLREQARTHVLESADVIASTFGTLARQAGRLPPVHTAVVDEVTQALEPAVWVALPFVKRLVLAGDPHQLGPVVLEPGNPLEHGLLDRLSAQGTPLPMLEVQHRMHADIQRLVSGIYGPSYTPHPAVAGHRLADLAGVTEGPVTAQSVRFVDTAGAGEEARDPRTRSVFEPLEVRVVGKLLAELRASGVRPDQIGVIAPYSAQVTRLAALPEARDVEVATVNAFQGREAEVVIVSFTRSNLDGELGFVADRRRLTVAVTRARRALWMVGDSATLTRHPMFTDLLADVPTQSVWESPWDVLL